MGGKTTHHAPAAKPDAWLRVADAARLLGVSPNTLRRAGSYRGLRCYRSPGGHRRYRRADVEGFLAVRRSGEHAEGTEGADAGAAASDEAGELRRRVRDLTALVETNLAVTAKLAGGVDDVLRTVAVRLCEITGAADCDISVVDGDHLVGAVSVQSGVVDQSWEGQRVPMRDLPVTSIPVRTGRPNMVCGLTAGELDPAVVQAMRTWGYESCLTVPMRVRGEVVGVVELLDPEPRDFRRDLEVATSLAQTAAQALDNARLVERVERQNAVLRELVELGARVGAARDPHAMARDVALRVREVTSASTCAIYRLEGGVLRGLAAVRGGEAWPEAESAHRVLGELPATAAALERCEPLIVCRPSDARLGEAERRTLEREGVCSEVALPLVVDDRVVGVIDLSSEECTDWADDLDFLRSVAQLVAGALDKALLLGELERRNIALEARTTELDQLVEAGLEFGASLELEQVLQSAATRMAELAGAAGCDLYRLEDGVAYTLMSVKHGALNDDYVDSSFRLEEYALWTEAVNEQRPVAVEDVLRDPRASERDRWAAQHWGYRAELDLPLVVQGRVIGLAGVFSVEPRTFERLDVLQVLCQTAAQAIANASLYRDLDRSARRLELVAAQGLALSATLDLDAVVEATARSLRAAGGYADCDVYTLDGDGLLCVTAIAGDERVAEDAGRRLPLDDWPTLRQAVETGMIVALDSLDDPRIGAAEREARRERSQRSVVVVPLVAKERVAAVVELIDRAGREHDAELLATVEALARVAGLALDNAELYGDIKGMHLSNLKALSSALNAKDYYTLGHAARVASYMVLLGKELGWPAEFTQRVEEAAYLHDIGKIGVSDRVLSKPGGLNAHEWELMRQHPIFSADIIRPLFDDSLVLGVRHHHERFDGSGYPDALSGDVIPEVARVMCVVDSYDAMSFRRPYRQALDFAECVAELRRCSGSQFDPEIVEAFVTVLERLRRRKKQAEEVARLAADRIDAASHATLDGVAAEQSPTYRQVMAALEEIRGAHPPTRYLGTRVRSDGGFVIVADVGGDAATQSHIGDEVFADDELAEAFAGQAIDSAVLYVDEFGVWVSGLAPIRAADGTVVAVAIADMPPPGADESEMEGLRSDVTQTFSSMLRSAAARLGRAEIEAITDGLSGLYNHRYLHERLEEEVERARDQGRPLSLLLCDIDRFKEYNEEHGHSAGDEALRTVARVIEGSIRHVDLAARYGGGEFGVILVDTDAGGALEVAERLRAGVADSRPGRGEAPLRVSVGAATYPDDAATKAELLDKADWAMYLAKRQGRDRVLGFRRQPGGAAG